MAHTYKSKELYRPNKKALTLRKGYVTLLTETHGAIREPQAPLGQQEHLSVQTELHCNWVTHLKKDAQQTLA